MAKGLKTGGRKAGTPNKATMEIKEAARQYAPAALEKLHQIMQTGESDAAKVAAAREILDRAYGKPSQAIIGGGEEEPPVHAEVDITAKLLRMFSDEQLAKIETEIIAAEKKRLLDTDDSTQSITQ